MLQLYIGNKNYSSWSMRAWVLLRQAGIPFDEQYVRFDSFDNQSEFKRTMTAVSPTGTVPLLRDGDTTVWDSLAIAEYVAEQFPEKALWPKDKAARAAARSICAEMHGGFTALRGACPMNIDADLAEVGKIVWRDNPACARTWSACAACGATCWPSTAARCCLTSSALPTPISHPSACA